MYALPNDIQMWSLEEDLNQDTTLLRINRALNPISRWDPILFVFIACPMTLDLRRSCPSRFRFRAQPSEWDMIITGNGSRIPAAPLHRNYTII
jgi:hypothetical protein